MCGLHESSDAAAVAVTICVLSAEMRARAQALRAAKKKDHTHMYCTHYYILYILFKVA